MRVTPYTDNSSMILEEESQQETINYGYEVLVKCGTQVVQGLSGDAKKAALLLLKKHLISDRLLADIVQFPSIDNGHKLYIEVLNKVKHFPQRYPDFISVLKEDANFYSDLLTSLKEAYHELGKN